jgi:hypothetical protein
MPPTFSVYCRITGNEFNNHMDWHPPNRSWRITESGFLATYRPTVRLLWIAAWAEEPPVITITESCSSRQLERSWSQ